ncbi:putative protein N(5)-glutamine methyltransferase [Cellulomonas sp. ATA003]|uniref:putative protein N(5)-glutamine methyltransferase n=1 Tax=Cellulomonas sp. ATA003 TaxID=3073064 RepID=UPI0028738478|nr:putative protein N(5)-glutamine methyltransferase [Cellulomonas sp. ATA003]WNB87187.1 putative protein N(5)-glutamine methyltransferase [Cellulomonas sp. ATA003]
MTRPVPGGVDDVSDAATDAVVVARLRAAGCVFAEDEARLLVDAAGTPVELAALVERRTAGEPLEHVLGWAEFCGVRIAVDPGVFVPRRRTALLVREALALLPGADPVVVDLCCGSGAVGAAVLDAAPHVVLLAADVDPAAVRCAHRNVVPRGGRVLAGDLYDALPASLRGRVDVLVANAPYVPTDAIGFMPPEARTHEAPVALDGGPDGLGVLRRVLDGAPAWLRPGGHVVVESGARQADALRDAVAAAGLVPRVVRWADVDATAVVGRRPG